MTDDLKKMMDKIEKLMAMSSSANPNEAAAFLEKAQALMAEYNLTQTDLLRNQLGEVRVKSMNSVSKTKDWEQNLMFMVAQAFGCRLTWFKGNSNNRDFWGRYNFIGQKIKLPLVEYTAVMLLRQLMKARAEYSSHLTVQGWRGREKSAKLDGYCSGWVMGVREKVTIFANPSDFEEILNERMDRVKNQAKARETDKDARAYVTGIVDGSAVDINRPVNQGAGPKMIGG